MKKLFLIAAALVASTVAAQAEVILANPCSRVSFVSDLRNVNFIGCQVEDKIFTNFANVDGTTQIPDNWQVTLDLDTDTGDHIVNFARGTTGDVLASATSPWGISYDVQVDTTYNNGISLYKYITAVGVSLDLAGVVKAGTLTKTITNLDPNKGNIGDVLGVASIISPNGPNVSPAILIYPSQYIHVVEVITSTSGGLQSFTDAYAQSYIPEPATYGMIGLGLAALGLISRRKKA